MPISNANFGVVMLLDELLIQCHLISTSGARLEDAADHWNKMALGQGFDRKVPPIDILAWCTVCPAGMAAIRRLVFGGGKPSPVGRRRCLWSEPGTSRISKALLTRSVHVSVDSDARLSKEPDICWPRDLSVVRPRSRCPQCGHQLTWFENIPVLSWLALRARCRSCRQRIPAIYPLAEIGVGLLWALCFSTFGPTFTSIRLAVVLTILVGVALTDLQHYLIPDGYTITGLLFALVTAFAAPFVGESTIFASPFDAVVGPCAGAGLIAIIGWLGEVALRKEAMGMGDMTLMAFVGATLGPTRALATIFVGAAISAVTFLAIVYPIALLRRQRVTSQTELSLDGASGRAPVELPLVPFGVFLAPAAAAMLLWGDLILERILS